MVGIWTTIWLNFDTIFTLRFQIAHITFVDMIYLLNVPRRKCIGFIETYWWTILFCYHWKIFVDSTCCWAIMHNRTKIVWSSVIVKLFRYISKINSETVIAPGTSFSPDFDMIMGVSTKIKRIKNISKWSFNFYNTLTVVVHATIQDHAWFHEAEHRTVHIHYQAQVVVFVLPYQHMTSIRH